MSAFLPAEITLPAPVRVTAVVTPEGIVYQCDPPRPVVTPAPAGDVRARRELLTAWGVPAATLYHRIRIDSPAPGYLVIETGFVLSTGQNAVWGWLVVPDVRRTWPAAYVVALDGVAETVPLGHPPPPAVGLTSTLAPPLHVFRYTGGFSDSAAYVEFCRYPEGEEGPTPRGLALDAPEAEWQRLRQSIGELHQLTRSRTGPVPATPTQIDVQVGWIEEAVLKARGPKEAPETLKKRLSQEELGKYLSGGQYGSRGWRTWLQKKWPTVKSPWKDIVQPWMLTLPYTPHATQRLTPSALPDGAHLRDMRPPE